MVMVFKYDRTLFAHATIERVSDQLRTVLEQMAAAADQQVENISLLTQEQRQLLARGWSGAVSDFSDQETVPQRVASHAEKAPQAAALIAGGKQLSYGELNQRANQLAHYLQGLGLRPGSRAAICLDQEFDLMVAMLGVLKTGAAFVIVKSDEPTIRTTGILEDADADLIITEQHLQHRFGGSSRLVLVDAHQEELQRQSDCELNAPVDADRLACLLYHSSPDDAPHGTLISHRALRSATFAAELAIGIKDRVAHTLDLSLEGTCFEIFTALASGACIVSIPRQSLPPRKFAEFMREQRVTVLVTTSAVFTRLASQFPLALKKVHLILIKDPLRLAGSLAQTLPSQTLERVYGAYGYSEAGGPSLLYPLKKLVDGGAIATEFILGAKKCPWVMRSSLGVARKHSFPIPLPKRPGRGCTAPATGRVEPKMVRWSLVPGRPDA
jgi:non-ribosomal peptide synthetase component F